MAITIDGTAGIIVTGSVNPQLIQQSVSNYSGAIIQIKHFYDDTTAYVGGGTTPNYQYFTPYYITLIRSESTLFVKGTFPAHTNDDSSFFIQYNVNGGAWVGPTSLMNSQLQTYSGLGDACWSHASNGGPMAHPIHNSVTASAIGATAGSIVGFRMGIINETNLAFCAYNRSPAGQDNTVNYATSRAFMTIIEHL